jgi:flagellar hook-length control protein FliK
MAAGAAGAVLAATASGNTNGAGDAAAKAGTAPAASATTSAPGTVANPAASGANAAGTPTAANTGRAAASSASNAASSGGASNGGEVDRVRFVQRVAKAFQAADDEGGQIRLRLSPPQLGSMKLEITMSGGAMTAHVETETAAARNMLLDNLPALRQRLADQNIKIDHFDVDLKDQSGGGTASGSGFANSQNQSPIYVPRTNSTTATSQAATPSSDTSSLLGGSGQLNVVV